MHESMLRSLPCWWRVSAGAVGHDFLLRKLYWNAFDCVIVYANELLFCAIFLGFLFFCVVSLGEFPLIEFANAIIPKGLLILAFQV